ncbi:hypothetical protein VNI00_017663 [Paramarasmius palmivorus]|uniref:Uncharacterized protein n=1 Tax=Paramarasmius palmivorus TaxID=297713 RepID=A0AAW0B5I5_9AGAR
MLNFFLGLSGVLPLHIKVVLAFQWGDENSTQTILPACPIIDQLLQRPWKSLDIQGSPRHSTISFLHGIIPRVPPNVLTQLDLHIAEGPTNDSYRALSRLPSTITTLRLSFGCVYPDSGVSFSISLPHITHLRVRGCVRSIFTVLIGSPQVQHLEAVMVGNDMPEWDLIVEMPSLERIWASVESYPGHELLPFFRYLHAPSTNSIVVYWNIGLPQLTPGLSVAMDKFIWHLDNLTELTLLRTPFSFQEARAMQGSATRLFYASADTYRWRFSSLGRYENWGWTRAGSPGGDSDSLASSVENEWGNLTSPDNLWSSHNPWTSTDDPRDYGSY